MNYISTKELAGKWKIDTSRILRLAKEGRIPGAVLVGNSWMFPADSERPSDNRRKENKTTVQRKPFRFPLYYFINHTKEMLDQFTEDERVLYDAECAYIRDEYAACRDVLTKLAEHTKDLTVKIGALYSVCMSNLYLHNFIQAAQNFREIQQILLDDIPHKQVLVLIMHDLESYFTGNSFYLDEFTIQLDPSYMPQIRDYSILQIAFSELMQAYFKGIDVNLFPYELFISAEGKSLTPYTSALLHLYVAMLEMCAGQSERWVDHLRESCRITEENRIEKVIAFAFHYIPEAFNIVLKDTNPDQLQRLKKLAKEADSIFDELHEALILDNVLHQLDTNDIKFVDFARQRLTNKEIGAILGLSMNTINKKYAVIFEKTGTHSKKELVRLYVSAMEGY